MKTVRADLMKTRKMPRKKQTMPGARSRREKRRMVRWNPMMKTSPVRKRKSPGGVGGLCGWVVGQGVG